jgi:hypothetical protein
VGQVDVLLFLLSVLFGHFALYYVFDFPKYFLALRSVPLGAFDFVAMFL